MSQLVEVTRRIANTKAGKDQLEYERGIAMMDAYGGMYRSINNGWEFSRTYIGVRTELSYAHLLDAYYEEDDEG